jgi:protein-S-isoprenylcysteine O-methyltransferase Ste14
MTLGLLPFAVVLAGDFLLLLVVAVSIFFPKHRVWPPPKKNSWQQWVSWSLFTVAMFGTPLVGVFDFESIGQGHWVLFLLGSFAFFVGLGVDLWGTKTLTAQQSLGDKGKIITQGPYRFTRNPQYVGFILIYTGIIVVTFSYMALVSGLLLMLTFFILPFSEEPWLRQQYGKPFEEYCKQVPRFIGIRSFKRTARLPVETKE